LIFNFISPNDFKKGSRNYFKKENIRITMKNKIMVFLIYWAVGLLTSAQVSAQTNPNITIAESINKAVDLSFQNIDSALYFANKALVLAQNVDSLRLVFCAYRAIGSIYEDNNLLQEAQKTYAIALALADSHLQIEEKLTIYTDWAIIHKKLGQYAIARDFHLRTIEKAEKAKHWEMVEDGYHGLGTLYGMLSDFDESVRYYLLSIKAAEKWGNQEGIVFSHQNISNTYLKAKNYDMALKMIEKTYQEALALRDSSRIANVLRVYGNIKIALKDYEDALNKHEAAKYIFEKQGNTECLAESYLSIGDIYFQWKNYAQAEHYFSECTKISTFLPNYSHADLYNKYGKLFQAQDRTEEAIHTFQTSLVLTDSMGFKDIARESHLSLAAIFSEQAQFDSAYLHLKMADRMAEKLFQETQQKSLTEAEFKFDVEKRDLQIDAQQKQLSQSQLIRWILIGSLFVLAALLLITWKQMRAKQRTNKRNELIVKELHHRVKNNMQTIASMMRLQARQAQDPAVSAILLENKTRLETFSMLHQQLYLADNIETLNLQPFIQDIIEKTRYSNGLDDTQLQTHLRLENTTLNVETALSVGLILNELLTNSLKYAYPSLNKSKPLEINIDILEDRFHYADNGNVLQADFDFKNKAGFGIQFISSFAHQIKGKYKFFVDKGVHFDLLFSPNGHATVPTPITTDNGHGVVLNH
jgi:two-component system, sensor histidine kinase PdtaS